MARSIRLRKGGDIVDAWEEITEEMDAAFRRFCRQRVPAADLEDVVQDIWVRVLSSPLATGTVANLRAYAMGIARYAAADYWRQHQPTLELDAVHPPGMLDQALGGREFWNALSEALAAMPPMLRQLWEEQALEGAGLRELAQRYSIPEGTVKSRLYAARKEIQARLAPRLDESLEAGRLWEALDAMALDGDESLRVGWLLRVMPEGALWVDLKVAYPESTRGTKTGLQWNMLGRPRRLHTRSRHQLWNGPDMGHWSGIHFFGPQPAEIHLSFFLDRAQAQAAELVEPWSKGYRVRLEVEHSAVHLKIPAQTKVGVAAPASWQTRAAGRIPPVRVADASCQPLYLFRLPEMGAGCPITVDVRP